MLPEKLTNYIKVSLEKGFTEETITAKLVEAGWSKEIVENALRQQKQVTLQQNREGTNVNTQSLGTNEQGKTPNHQENKVIKYVYDILVGYKKYPLFITSLIIAVLACIYPSFIIITKGIPLLDRLNDNIKSAIEEVIPEDVEITIKNGQASSNVTEPYFITISQSTIQNIFQVENTVNQPLSKIRLLTINTEGQIEDFERFQSLAMLTANNLVFYSEDSIQVEYLRDIPDITISRQYILDEYNNINANNEITNLLKSALMLSPVIIILIILLWFWFEVLITTFIVWIINKIHKTDIPFRRLLNFTGLLYAAPFVVLLITRIVPGAEVFYSWFYIAVDVIVLSTAYVLMGCCKKEMVC